MKYLNPPFAPSTTTVWCRSEASKKMAQACRTTLTIDDPTWDTVFKTLGL
jgi:hypothetical protein